MSTDRECGDGCACGPRSDLRTLTQTPGFNGVLRRTSPHEVLATLPVLDSADGVTGGGGMLMTQHGSYAPPMLVGDPLRIQGGAVTVRFAQAALDTIVIAEASAAEGEGTQRRIPASINLFTADERSSHRCYVTTPGGERLLHSIARGAQFPAGGAVAVTAPAAGEWIRDLGIDIDVTAEVPVVQDQLSAIDAVLQGNAIEHRESPTGVARWVLGQFFRQLAQLDVELTFIAMSGGCAQFSKGTIVHVEEVPFGFAMHVDAAAVLVRPEFLRACDWSMVDAPSGRVPMVQLYDAAGSCLGIVTQTGIVHPDEAVQWRKIVMSLPAEDDAITPR